MLTRLSSSMPCEHLALRNRELPPEAIDVDTFLDGGTPAGPGVGRASLVEQPRVLGVAFG